jgi:hypothetical protein
VGAAHGPQRADVPAFRHARDTLAPLAGTLEVAHALAGEDQVTAGEADRDRVAHLAGGRRRSGLVETRHALGDLALADPRQAIERDRRHLQVDVAELSAERLGLRAALARHRGVARVDERRLAQRQPAPFPRRAAPLEQPAGPPQPAVANRALAAHCAVVPGERDRDPRRVDRPAGVAIARIRALAAFERQLGLVEEESSPRQSLEGLRRFFPLQRLGEEPLRCLPVGVAQRLIGVAKEVPRRGHGVRHRPHSLADRDETWTGGASHESDREADTTPSGAYLYGSDGTRTRDLRRDRPAVPRSPSTASRSPPGTWIDHRFDQNLVPTTRGLNRQRGGATSLRTGKRPLRASRRRL